MASNNSLNKSFPSSLTMTGTVNINATGTGTTSLGNVSNPLSFTSGSTSSVALSSIRTVTVSPGSNAINIGTDSTTKTISIGNTTGSLIIRNAIISLFSGITIASTKTATFTNSGGSIIADIGGGFTMTINPGTTLNIGTVAADIPITIGNSNGTSTLTIASGTGGLNIGTSGAKTINIGSTTGSSPVVLQAGNTSGLGIFYPSINITGTTANLIPGLIHVINSGALLCTLTLPTTAAVGTLITIVGFASGLWIINQNSGQTINSTASSTTTGITGTLAAANRYACVQIRCTVANTTWSVKSFSGTLTYV